MFNIRKITNALVVSYNDENQQYTEQAFLLSDPTVVDQTKAFITEKKVLFANHAETQGHQTVDTLLAS